jgi:membrane protein DedA with SNARE-associated domain
VQKETRTRVALPTYAGPVNEPAPTSDVSGADRRLTVLASLAALSFLVATVGTFLSARLVKSHPAVLLALSARNRHLLLVKGTEISALAFVVVPLLRIMPVSIVYFLLGRDYGDRGKSYLQREAGGVPGTINWAERIFDRIGPASLMIFAGSQLAWLLAGLRQVRFRVMVAWELAGMLARIAFFWLLGEKFKPQIEKVLNVIQRFQGPLTAVLLLVVINQTRKTMKRMEAQQIENGLAPTDPTTNDQAPNSN